jgi:hypothetical protein
MLFLYRSSRISIKTSGDKGIVAISNVVNVKSKGALSGAPALSVRGF